MRKQNRKELQSYTALIELNPGNVMVDNSRWMIGLFRDWAIQTEALLTSSTLLRHWWRLLYQLVWNVASATNTDRTSHI